MKALGRGAGQQRPFSRATASIPEPSSWVWETFFYSEVSGLPTKEYLSRTVLPRPRDIVYFYNAAVGRAIDRRNERVLEGDFLSAEETYSRYAYEALLVENGVTIPEMEDALFGFLGCNHVLRVKDAQLAIGSAGVVEHRIRPILDKLISMSFLGIEIKPGVFHFPEVGSDFQRSVRLPFSSHPGMTRGLRFIQLLKLLGS
ncbi:hypothetical protein QFZ30_002255 [Arthrobacter pascens]|uniref:P-loop ATPase, Sll1717 family n=1 Tax=Arthrobacter pascens TaxID=1677 RepID=UPI002790FD44|nr:hypothetical protein [Arthrobacter pascens]MDQ0678873.1 hypothetical protein [Arthrobacter pascens]